MFSIMDGYGLNISQAEAVSRASNMQSGFLLIQGPPGTGKTTFISRLISYLSTHSLSPQTAHKPKVLLCAPSNAAIDEVTLRLANHLKTATPEKVLVRMGSEEKMSRSVSHLSLDRLVAREYTQEQRRAISELQGKLTQILTCQKSEIKALEEYAKEKGQESAFPRAPKNPRIKFNLGEMKGQYRATLDSLASLRSQEKHCRGKIGDMRHVITTRIIRSADIIACTLSGSGSKLFKELKELCEIVIIDEATQATEPETLIPLGHGCMKCILVGGK